MCGVVPPLSQYVFMAWHLVKHRDFTYFNLLWNGHLEDGEKWEDNIKLNLREVNCKTVKGFFGISSIDSSGSVVRGFVSYHLLISLFQVMFPIVWNWKSDIPILDLHAGHVISLYCATPLILCMSSTANVIIHSYLVIYSFTCFIFIQLTHCMILHLYLC
jgi:hypothetical protein